MGFKTIEVQAYNLEEALEQVDFVNVDYTRNATQAWKKAGCPALAGLREFMCEYLKTRKVPSGVIVLHSGTADTKERPYKIVDITNDVVTGTITRLNKETGKEETVDTSKRKFETVIELVDAATNTVIDRVKGTKADAKEVARDIYKGGFTGKIIANYIKVVSSGEPRAFEVDYSPSINAELGKYLVFGVTED